MYDTDKRQLISILGWFELSCQLGRNLGGLLIVLFSPISIQLGSWHLDQSNFGNFVISILSLVLLVISALKITNISRDMDRLIKKQDLRKFRKDNKQHTQNEPSKINTSKYINSKETTTLMKWTDLLQVDILTMIASFSLIRYMSFAVTSYISISTATVYHWHSNYLFILFVTCDSVFTILITVMNSCKILQSPKRSFYFYNISLTISSMVLITLMWTKQDILNTLVNQIAFFLS